MKTSTGNKLENQTNATKLLVNTYSILVGLTAIVHGFYETLQGNEPIKESLIDAIGPKQRLWEYSILHAVSYAPTYMIAGILAIIMGILVIVWSLFFIEKRLRTIILFFLIILTFLVGGGYGAPLSLGLLAILASLRINRPILKLNDYLSSSFKTISIKLWPASLIVLIVVFVGSVFITIIGWPFVNVIGPKATNSLVWLLVPVMMISMILAVLDALIYDGIHPYHFSQPI